MEKEAIRILKLTFRGRRFTKKEKELLDEVFFALNEDIKHVG